MDHGIKIPRHSPLISHLLYVDDMMIFFKANSNEANAVLSYLLTYSNWSGKNIPAIFQPILAGLVRKSISPNLLCSLARIADYFEFVPHSIRS
jgi:hypothetical protein